MNLDTVEKAQALCASSTVPEGGTGNLPCGRTLLATIRLLEGKPPSEDSIWREDMRLVQQHQYGLGRALATALEASFE
ncbi:hypothetical protein ACIQVE_12105 [Pseudomonas sp. NPDC098747]|uniref:hypothetical protein n=1 Tax=Pseudomonas sp. NPDC098747 TaxID=3364487 RepID=UPI00383A1E7B